ncbi:MAG: GNAT family N-acetyltransferase, partial [Terriglobia bacterium]
MWKQPSSKRWTIDDDRSQRHSDTPTSEQVQSRMMEGPVWIALHNDAVVGTASAVARGEALYIRSMAILPTARGQGIG